MKQSQLADLFNVLQHERLELSKSCGVDVVETIDK